MISTVDRQRLVESHLDLIQHVVNQVASRYPRHVDRGELWNAGALGLVDASRRFDRDAGVPFERYAAIRIRGAIIDSTRSRDWAPRALRRKVRAANRAADDFAVSNGRHPEPDELAGVLGIPVERLAALRAAASASSVLQLDHRLTNDDGEDTTLGELLPERSPEHLPEAQLEQRELLGTVRTAVANLPDIQREVIERYFFGGEYLRDIAETYGVTEARMSQVRSEALNAIRAYFHESFEGVPEVDDSAPGRRSRAAFVSAMAARSTWRTRLEAAVGAEAPAQTA